MLQLSKWDLDVETSDEEEYTSLARSVRRTHKRFKLLFVSCSPSQGEKIRCDLMADIPTKKYELLGIKESIDNLYELINNIPNLAELDVLFIRGLEYSIFEYEDQEFGDISKRSQSDVYGGSWAGVPPVLARLNMQRELFRDRLPQICFVFLLPHFAVDYFIRRAPDFYDWKSGIYRFKTDAADLRSQATTAWDFDDYDEYENLNAEEKLAKIREVKACLDEVLDPDLRWQLLFQLAAFSQLCNLYLPTLDALNRLLQIRPNDSGILDWCGSTLNQLGRYEEAITSYDRSLELNPDKDEAWYNRGIALGNLGRYEEAIASYDRSLELKPDQDQAWNNRGYALDELGRYEDAIASYDRSLELKPDKDEAWYNRGIALRQLGRYEEAIASYDRSLEIKPDDKAWHNKGLAFYKWGKYQDSLNAYEQAINIKPDKHESWHDQGFVLFHIGSYDAALAAWKESFNIISKFKPSDTNDLIQEFLDEQLLPKFQQLAVRDILPQLLTIYTTAQVLPELGVALTRNLKAIQSPIISDYTAAEWLMMWQELGKPHPELALALRMLEAGIKYKQNPTDDRVFLSLPQEMRPLLREALGLEP